MQEGSETQRTLNKSISTETSTGTDDNNNRSSNNSRTVRDKANTNTDEMTQEAEDSSMTNNMSVNNISKEIKLPPHLRAKWMERKSKLIKWKTTCF